MVCKEGSAAATRPPTGLLLIRCPHRVAAIRALGYKGVILGLTGNVLAADHEVVVTGESNILRVTLRTLLPSPIYKWGSHLKHNHVTEPE